MCQCGNILCTNTNGSDMLRYTTLKKHYYSVGETKKIGEITVFFQCKEALAVISF